MDHFKVNDSVWIVLIQAPPLSSPKTFPAYIFIAVTLQNTFDNNCVCLSLIFTNMLIFVSLLLGQSPEEHPRYVCRVPYGQRTNNPGGGVGNQSLLLCEVKWPFDSCGPLQAPCHEPAGPLARLGSAGSLYYLLEHRCTPWPPAVYWQEVCGGAWGAPDAQSPSEDACAGGEPSTPRHCLSISHSQGIGVGLVLLVG